MNQPTCLHCLLLCYVSKRVLRNIQQIHLLASFNYDPEVFSPSARKHIERELAKQVRRRGAELYRIQALPNNVSVQGVLTVPRDLRTMTPTNCVTHITINHSHSLRLFSYVSSGCLFNDAQTTYD
jgi:hypothetical protein